MKILSARKAPRNWHRAHNDSLTTGQRAADRLRNSMGSWAFVISFMAFMLIWAAVNSLTAATWDPYPYILLNLFLSMLAGLQGAILLIAAKRQDSISAALAQHDYDVDAAAKADIEEVFALNQQQSIVIAELHEILKRLDEDRAAWISVREKLGEDSTPSA
ncbi:DUF1003 domain-containing protein [Salinibacterium sp. SWN139]|uniref:DUF1003 domain-containing protein n=1 Tax=Salinibacterium sp. SWN139 TaxID=2792055 RepID=UPI0018CF14E7|nr:DUF1003 domain-containing protein [Salinibacterium sp. SWN139]MBH0054752.1 DUF1003 domain-containing protein [Salinibacterium sp. SWN139]